MQVITIYFKCILILIKFGRQKGVVACNIIYWRSHRFTNNNNNNKNLAVKAQLLLSQLLSLVT